VHGHGSPIKADYDQPMFTQHRQQDRVFGHPVLAPQPIGDMNDWKI